MFNEILEFEYYLEFQWCLKKSRLWLHVNSPQDVNQLIVIVLYLLLKNFIIVNLFIAQVGRPKHLWETSRRYWEVFCAFCSPKGFEFLLSKQIFSALTIEDLSIQLPHEQLLLLYFFFLNLIYLINSTLHWNEKYTVLNNYSCYSNRRRKLQGIWVWKKL